MKTFQKAVLERLLTYATDLEYVEMFGKTRVELRRQFGLKPAPISNDDERDYMSELALETLSRIERRWADIINSGALKNLSKGMVKMALLPPAIEEIRQAKLEAERQGINLLTGERQQ